MASPPVSHMPAREFPATRRQRVRTAPSPYPPGLSWWAVKGRQALVSLVHLPVSLAGPAPSGSASTSRHCQGCSRPPRRLPDQAALSFTRPLRRPGGKGLSPPLDLRTPRGAHGPQPSHPRRTTAFALPSKMPDSVSSLRENNQRPNETVLTPDRAGTTSQQRSTLPASRQGHDLSPGLKTRAETVLTCRRLPSTESAARPTR